MPPSTLLFLCYSRSLSLLSPSLIPPPIPSSLCRSSSLPLSFSPSLLLSLSPSLLLSFSPSLLLSPFIHISSVPHGRMFQRKQPLNGRTRHRGARIRQETPHHSQERSLRYFHPLSPPLTPLTPSHLLSPPLTSFSPLFLSRNGEAAEVVVSNGRVLLPSAEGCVIQEQAFRAELLLRTRQRQSYGTRMESCHGCQRKTRELAKYRYAQFIIRGWETKREEKGIP